MGIGLTNLASMAHSRQSRRRASLSVLLYTSGAIFALVVPCVGLLSVATVSSRPVFADDPEPKANQSPTEEESPFRQIVKLPQGVFDGGTEWLNTSGRITPRDLMGKIVILDFWTYCCINCMHVLPELKAIEQKYPNQVVVIGVHSAKFENEKETGNIRGAIQRYEIAHPVVNDSNMTIWDTFGVRAWPTISVVDPEGYLLGNMSGEAQREDLERIVDKLIAYHKKKGTLDETPVHFNLESAKLKPTPLRFPGKVLADEAGNRLFISDSNHNRIVISSLDGKLIGVIGNGTQGAADGNYRAATFNRPQGMALVGDTLYVADTENHLLRIVDLKAKTVSTLAGTGKQSRTHEVDGRLRETALNSPWALVHLDGVLYIAMAGPHQIWRHKLGSTSIEIHAGSGREDIIDGSLPSAAFAQPSDIVTDGKVLYVIDSEGSSVRKVSTDPAGDVTTVVGTADLPQARLFTFGDVDGSPPNVRFEHPIGLAYHEGNLLVADSYNHKIRHVSLGDDKGTTTTVVGDGTPGDRLLPPRLSEPEGLSVTAGKLFIADTNNHRIGVYDLNTKGFSVLEIEGLTPPTPPENKEAPAGFVDSAHVVEAKTLAPSETLKFDISLLFPEGFKLNKLAPLTYRLLAQDGQTLFSAEQLGQRGHAASEGTVASVSVPTAAKSGAATVQLSLTYGYCRDGIGGLCKMKTDHWRVPIELKADGKETVIRLTSDATK